MKIENLNPKLRLEYSIRLFEDRLHDIAALRRDFGARVRGAAAFCELTCDLAIAGNAYLVIAAGRVAGVRLQAATA